MDATEAQGKALENLLERLGKAHTVADAVSIAGAITKLIEAHPVGVTLVFDDGDSETDDDNEEG